MPNRDEIIGKCIPSCGGDIVKNGGASACCIRCGLLYDLEILTKNHSKSHQPQEAGEYVRTWGVPREPAAVPH
jgi:hypothetical protein